MGADRPRRGSLDVLRGLAATLVAVGHAYPVYAVPDPQLSALRATVEGQAPVVMFFALSGYLVAGPWLVALRDGRPLPSTREYAVRRAARLLPAYWFFLLLSVAVNPLQSPVQHGWQWPVHLLMLQSLVPGGEYIKVFPVAWTLGIEGLFYVAVPLLATAARRRLGPAPLGVRRLVRGLAGIWVVGTLLMALGDLIASTPTDSAGLTGPLRYDVQTMMGVFACGGIVAVCEPHRLRSRLTGPVACVLAGLTIVPAVMLGTLGHPLVVSELRYAVLGPAMALLIWACLRPGMLDDPRRTVLHALGRWSYGIYLSHTVILFWLRSHNADPARLVTSQPGAHHGLALLVVIWGVDAAATVALAALAGFLSWRFLERPAIRLAARRLAAARPPALTRPGQPDPVGQLDQPVAVATSRGAAGSRSSSR